MKWGKVKLVFINGTKPERRLLQLEGYIGNLCWEVLLHLPHKRYLEISDLFYSVILNYVKVYKVKNPRKNKRISPKKK